MTVQRPTVQHYLSVQWLMLGLALLTIGGVIGYSLVQEHSRIEEQERNRLLHQARLIDKNMGHQLDSVNLALEGLRKDLPYWRSFAGRQMANRRLTALCDAMPGIRTMIITDAAGTVLAANREEILGKNFSQRDYFNIPRRHPDSSVLYLSAPFKTTLGIVAMNVTRVITGPRGEFSGVVTATLDPEYFKTLLASVLYARDMWCSLAHGEGLQFLMVPDGNGQAGKNIAQPGSFFTRHRESGRAENVLSGIGHAPGKEQLMALHTIKSANMRTDKPLIVTVGRPVAAIYAEWRSSVRVQGALFGILLLISVPGLYVYQRHQRDFEHRAEEAAAALRESEGRYRSLFENDHTVMLLIDPDTAAITDANPAACVYYGWSREELMKRSISEINTLTGDEIHREIQLALTEKRNHFFFKHRRAGGTISDVEVYTSPIRLKGKVLLYSIVHDITDRKRMEEALRESEKKYRELSIIDDLTQLYNSRQFYHDLQMELDRVNRYRQPLTLLLLDIDDFKAFNDAYGHVEGDQVLLRLGQVVKRCLRQTDSAYRYGGEEFTILLPMTTSQDAAVTAERIRTEIKKEHFHPGSGNDVHITVSIGLAQYRTGEAMKPFVHRVDQLMYQGKTTGKDKVCTE